MLKVLWCCAIRSERHRFQVGVSSYGLPRDSFEWFSHPVWRELWSAGIHHATLDWRWSARLRRVCSRILLLQQLKCVVCGSYWHCLHSMQQGLCSSIVSVRPSVCPSIDCCMPLQWLCCCGLSGQKISFSSSDPPLAVVSGCTAAWHAAANASSVTF